MNNIEIILLWYIAIGFFWLGFDFYHLVNNKTIEKISFHHFIGSRLALIFLWPIFAYFYIRKYKGYYKDIRKGNNDN